MLAFVSMGLLAQLQSFWLTEFFPGSGKTNLLGEDTWLLATMAEPSICAELSWVNCRI